MIKISRKVLNEVVEYCRGALPSEACGALLGAASTDYIQVTDYVAIKNNSPEQEHHFVMDALEWMELCYAQKEIVGIFHSHVNTAAIPSNTDLQTLWHTLPSYWIVSLRNRHHPAVKAYKLSNHSFFELPINME